MSNPTWRGSTSVNGSGTGPTTINVPASVADGDLLLLYVTIAAGAGSGRTCTPPSGWTELYVFNNAVGCAFLYGRIASSEPSSYAFSISVSAAHSGIMHATTPSTGSWSTVQDAVQMLRYVRNPSGSHPVPAMQWDGNATVQLHYFGSLGRGSTTSTKSSTWTLGQNPDTGGTTAAAVESLSQYKNVSAGTAPADTWTTSNGAGDWGIEVAVIDPSETMPACVRSIAQTTAGGATTSFNCTMPPLARSGDLLIMGINTDTGALVNTPSGWTLDESSIYTDDIYVFSKVASGSEGSSVALTSTNARLWNGEIIAIGGSLTGKVAAGSTQTAASATVTVPALTAAAQSPGFLLHIATNCRGDSNSNISAIPSGDSPYWEMTTGRYPLIAIKVGSIAGNPAFGMSGRFYSSADPPSGTFTIGGAIDNIGTSVLYGQAPTTQSGSFSASAVTLRSQAGSLTVDAVLWGFRTSSLSADAVLWSSLSGSLTADAVLVFVGSGSLTSDTVLRRSQSESLTADAVISTGGSTQSGSLTADAVARRTQTASFIADALIVSVGNGTLTGDAILRLLQSGAFIADAMVRRSQSGAVTTDAALRRTSSASLAMDAVARRTMAGSFTADSVFASWFRADAIVLRTQEASFTAGAWIYAPRADPEGPGGPGETPLVSIMVEGVDITADVILSDASFVMQVNGTPGPFRFRVRDDGQAYVFVSGAEVTLDIDGKRKFGGFLISPKHGFAFPVMKTSNPASVSRFWTLEGVDYNILFSKRVVRDKSNPNDVELRSWPAGSRDDVVIKYVFDNYTDLGADGVTYNGVTHVGSPNPDKKGVVASGGLTFGDAMTEINRLINGVFYIDQYKDLHFVDVETPNATYGLSDRPETGEIGYRELEKVNDGSKLANDALVWAAGLGSKHLKFSRSQDAASIAAHKRWQFGDFSTQLIKQASADMRAESIVYGTDQNKRGGKDDQESWRVTTFSRTFEVGQKVQIETEVFGQSDVVPIRRMEITFPSKKKPKFELLLSHEIDLPWNTFETRFPKIKTGFSIGDIEIPDPVFPPPGGCADVAGITDTFTRSTTNYEGSYYTGNNWGVADAGLQWHGSAWYVWVDGSSGVIGIHPSPFGGGPAWSQQQYLDLSGGVQTFDGTFEAVLNRGLVSGTGDGEYFEVWCGYFSVLVLGTGSVELTDFTNTTSTSTPVTLTSPFKVRLTRTTGDFEVRIWQATDAEPATPTLSLGHTGEYNLFGFYVGTDMASIGSALELRVDNLDIEGLNRVSEYRFDNFDRTVPGSDGGLSPAYGWGYPSNGTSYWVTNSSSANVSVNGSQGVVESSASSEVLSAIYQGPDGSGADIPFRDSFEMRTDFVISQSLPSAKYIQGQFSILENVGDALHGRVWWYFANDVGDPPLLIVQDAGGSTSVEVGSYTPGETIHLAWSLVVNSENKAKIWFGSEAEPDWMVSRTASGGTAGAWSRVIVGQNQNWAPATVKFDFIDFDYDGKPCYAELDAVVIDDWDNRTLSLSSSAGSWGSTSGSGDPWANPVGGASSATYGVASGVGQIAVAVPGSGSGSGFVTLNEGGSDYSPWFLAGAGVPDELFTGGEITYALDFMVDDITSTYMELWVTDNVATDVGGVMVGVWASSASKQLYLDSYDASQVTLNPSPVIWAANTWYTIKVQIKDSYASVKVWKRGDPEPGGWQATIFTTALPWTPGVVDLMVQSEKNSNTVNFYFDNFIRYAGVDVGAGAGGEPAGRSGQSGTGAKTVFTLDYAYHWGSTRVFVDGYIQRRGVDYTESDPDGGEITFTVAPADGAAVTILYEANGSPH